MELELKFKGLIINVEYHIDEGDKSNGIQPTIEVDEVKAGDIDLIEFFNQLDLWRELDEAITDKL